MLLSVAELDASLGTIILQQFGDKPVAYASRLMSDTEKRYAQIEKEPLACYS